jgi:hypothetical protein
MRYISSLLLSVAIAACTGADGTSDLVSVTDEPAGVNCANGGVRIDSGPDTNANGAIDSSEITTTKYVCSGKDGSSGAAPQIVKVADPAAAVAANTNMAVTILSAPITTTAAGKLLAIASVDAYCDAVECPAGNPAADGTIWLSAVDTEMNPPGDADYFYLTPNTTEGVSRAQDFTIAAAGTFTYYLRGKDAINSFTFFRPSITLVYLP